MSHGYGWKRQLPDHRDLRFAPSPRVALNLPSSTDLRPGMPPVYDQGQLGSCTANAVAAAFQFDQMKQGLAGWNPSRLFVYYNERILEGTVPYDAGAEMRDSIKAVVQYGAVPETEWPYEVAKFADAPPRNLYDEALLNQGLVYSAVNQNLCTMQGVLASGFPFLVGFIVYESFEQDQPGAVMPMPSPGEQVLSGHAVVAVGYDNSKRLFTMRNSWGDSWGDAGYFYFPYDYLTNTDYSSDFWVLQTVESGN